MSDFMKKEMQDTAMAMRAEADQKIADMQAIWASLPLDRQMKVIAWASGSKLPANSYEYTMLVGLAQIGLDEVLVADARQRGLLQ